MGIFTYEKFLLDILYKKKLQARNDDMKIHRGHLNFGVVNDPDEILHEIFELLPRGQ
jgi:hypothetical protein